MRDPNEFELQLRQSLVPAQLRNAEAPIRLPESHGAFPSDLLIPAEPVVPDACCLRNDILYACRNDRRTVLVNAANHGLLRLFCAQHVIDEVFEHASEWTRDASVSEQQFRESWASDYLPLIRVVPIDEGLLRLLGPDERARLDALWEVDPDDISAALAVLLGAFYLSTDTRALCAAYGKEADLSAHSDWVEVLKAGGDAGELGRTFGFFMNLLLLLGSGVVSGAKRLVGAVGPLGLVPVGLAGAMALQAISTDQRRRIKSAAGSTAVTILQIAAAYEAIHERFRSACPVAPGWDHLAETNSDDDVLARACLVTLARAPQSHLSAAELARQLPFAGVPRGEAKVRENLRTYSCFSLAWRGRWQVGEPDPAVLAMARQYPPAS